MHAPPRHLISREFGRRHQHGAARDRQDRSDLLTNEALNRTITRLVDAGCPADLRTGDYSSNSRSISRLSSAPQRGRGPATLRSLVVWLHVTFALLIQMKRRNMLKKQFTMLFALALILPLA